MSLLALQVAVPRPGGAGCALGGPPVVTGSLLPIPARGMQERGWGRHPEFRALAKLLSLLMAMLSTWSEVSIPCSSWTMRTPRDGRCFPEPRSPQWDSPGQGQRGQGHEAAAPPGHGRCSCLVPPQPKGSGGAAAAIPGSQGGTRSRCSLTRGDGRVAAPAGSGAFASRYF